MTTASASTSAAPRSRSRRSTPTARELDRRRIPTPPGYDATLAAMVDLVREVDQHMGGAGSVGIGIPGVISPATGLVKNANCIALNGHPLRQGSSRMRSAATVRVENDANCFALSEAADGAGAGQTACSASSSAPAAAAASWSTAR